MKPRDHILNILKNVFIVKFRPQPKIDTTKIKNDWHAPYIPAKEDIEPRISWIGHSTFLIQIDGINILTDPIFFSPSIFYPRLLPPGIPLSKLPPIHVIVISHNHIDHMDKPSLIALKHHNPLLLIPRGTSRWFARKKFTNVIENKWGDKHSLIGNSGKMVTFAYLPAEHWTGRHFFDINKSDHGSWMIEHDGQGIYFAGDSSYAGHFTEIGQQFPNTIAALMPIGPIEPRYSVEHAHMDSYEAIKAFIDLKAKSFLPMHWGTFHMGTEKYDEPIVQLKDAWIKQKERLVNKALQIVKFGKAEKLLV